MAAILEAATITVANNATSNLAGVNTWSGKVPIEMLVRVSASGVYFGNSGVTASNGYQLNANQEYTFRFYPVFDTSSSADSAPYVYNNSGGSVTVSYVVTPLR